MKESIFEKYSEETILKALALLEQSDDIFIRKHEYNGKPYFHIEIYNKDRKRNRINGNGQLVLKDMADAYEWLVDSESDDEVEE